MIIPANRLIVLSLCCLSLLGCDAGGEKPQKTSTPHKDKTVSPAGDSAQTASQKPSSPQTISGNQTSSKTPPERSSPQAAQASGPRWECQSPIYDFGEVWAGEMIRHSFSFRNIGNQSLKILEAKPRCSCSVAENYTREVSPGKSGVIPFRLNTTNKSGQISEYLTIKTNDPKQPNMTITLQGVVNTVCQLEVIADASLSNGAASAAGLNMIKKRRGNFGRITRNQKLHRVIRMTNTSGSPLTLSMLAIRPTTAPFKTKLVPVQPDDVYDLIIDGKPPFPVGHTMASVSFVTNIPGKQVYTVPIHAYVPARIEVIPYKIVADEMSWKIKRRPIRITNNGTGPFEITSISVSDPNYKLRLLPDDAAKPNYHELELMLPPGQYRPPPYGEIVRIKTTDKEMPLIDIFVLPHLRKDPTPRPANKPLTFYPGKM